MKIIKFIFCAILCFVQVVYAKDVTIIAKKLTIDQFSQIATYEGDVTVKFADLKITTNKLLIYGLTQKDKNISNFSKIYFPQPFQVIKYNAKNEVIESLKANTGVFEKATSTLKISGNIVLRKKDSVFKTNQLIYYTKSHF